MLLPSAAHVRLFPFVVLVSSPVKLVMFDKLETSVIEDFPVTFFNFSLTITWSCCPSAFVNTKTVSSFESVFASVATFGAEESWAVSTSAIIVSVSVSCSFAATSF